MFHKKAESLSSRMFQPARIFIVLLLVFIIYLLPLGRKPEFIEHNGEIVEISRNSPVLESFYPQGINASCNGGPGFNCNTGCCSAGQCVVCPQDDPTPIPTYPPSISSATLTCSTGELVNGWCSGTFTLDLTAFEPQYVAVTISGEVDGNPFPCASGSTTCSVSISAEGTGTITYRASSVYGTSSDGSMNYAIDVTPPQITETITGTSGQNGYYVSVVTPSASADDSVSGIDIDTFKYSLDGGGSWDPFPGSVDLSDGEYAFDLKVYDNAGNYYESGGQSIKVDTIKPSLDLDVAGTMGSSNYYITPVQIIVTPNDAGSGIAYTQISIDGAPYVNYTAPVTLSDGRHTYQGITYDNAGNFRESPLQGVNVDTTFPAIDMTEETSLGDPVYLEIEDNGSELSTIRFVIEDEDERFKKVAWEETLSGRKYKDQILWDGKFKDGTQAPAGTYYITIKVTDAAGNESKKTASVTVGLFSFLKSIPPFKPPTNPVAVAPAATSLGDTTANSAISPQTGTSTAGNTPNPFANSTGLVGSGLGSTAAAGNGFADVNNLLGPLGLIAAGTLAYGAYRRKQEDEQQVSNGSALTPVVSSGSKGLGSVVAPAIPMKQNAGGPPWWEWIVKTAEQVLDKARQALQESLLGQAFPELTWTPLTTAESQTVLQNIINFSSQGANAAAHLQQHNTILGYFPQKTGAGWTILKNMILQPGVNLNSPYNNSLIIHEALHLDQGILTRLSVYGELLAWQLQYQAYYDGSGKYLGEQGTEFYDPAAPAKFFNLWRKLSLLDPNSPQDLATAQQLMVDISPDYRSKLLPLEPFTKTIARQVVKFGDDASNSITSAAKKAATAIAQNGQTLANKITDLGTSTAKKITQTSTTLANAVTTAGQNVAKAVTQGSQNVAKGINTAGQAFANLVAKVSPGAASSIVKTSQAVASIAVKTGQFVSTATNLVSQAASNVVKQGGQTAAKVVTSASKVVANTVSIVSRAAANTATKVAQAAANTVKSVASSISKLFWKP